PIISQELLAGGAAGGLAKTMVAPLERVKILFQTGRMRGKGVGETLRNILEKEGVGGLFRGNGASVLRIVPYAALHFGAYEYYRELLVKAAAASVGKGVVEYDVPPALDLVAGSAAGATAVLVTYPLDLVRTRLAYDTEANGPVPRVRLTIRGVLAATVRQEGALGLYRGIGPTLCGILPYAGLKFYVYQSLKQQYRRWPGEHHLQKLPVGVMLTFGACSGLVAQTFTYPLDVVRRQMQVQHLIDWQATQQIRSTWQGLRLIISQQGSRALFAGLSLNYMKVVPSTAIGFTIYDALKHYLGLPQHL
ncbi:mitochondrial carrier, partial [Coccomyxa subellipsoidea C-169]